jgi:hypothetical protein
MNFFLSRVSTPAHVGEDDARGLMGEHTPTGSPPRA